MHKHQNDSKTQALGRGFRLGVAWYYTSLGLDHGGYRNWPRYGLPWSGLCWHSQHSTSGAGPCAAACGRAGRLHECCAGSGSTNHDSADRMSGQFLFYHENEAMHNDKSCDDHDDEPPCWNALADNVTIVSGSHIDDVTIAELLTFEIISGAVRNERYGFRLSKTTWRFNYKWAVVFCNGEYHQRLNSCPWWQIFQVPQ